MAIRGPVVVRIVGGGTRARMICQHCEASVVVEDSAAAWCEAARHACATGHRALAVVTSWTEVERVEVDVKAGA